MATNPENRAFVPGMKVRHFKGGDYTILHFATNTETDEKMVVYQAEYGDRSIFVSPLELFMSAVDKKKYPNVSQTYWLEEIID